MLHTDIVAKHMTRCSILSTVLIGLWASFRVTRSYSNRALLALLMSSSTWDSFCCSEECVYCSAAFSEGLVGGPACVFGKGGKGRDRGGGGEGKYAFISS